MNSDEESPRDSEATPSFVVGIGASAGGLESLEKLFQNLPADTGMAFVIIQHLSPDFKSMMYELLARDTKMEIHRAEDGMSIQANHVYLLPPKKEIIIAGGELHLIDKDLSKGLTLPIDRFFESLGRDCRAVPAFGCRKLNHQKSHRWRRVPSESRLGLKGHTQIACRLGYFEESATHSNCEGTNTA